MGEALRVAQDAARAASSPRPLSIAVVPSQTTAGTCARASTAPPGVAYRRRVTNGIFSSVRCETEVRETETPYVDQRNIHFSVNRCGFHIVEFFHPGQRPEAGSEGDHPGPDRMFRFEKRMPV